MINKNNSLINTNVSIFGKIVNWFKKFFWKNKKKTENIEIKENIQDIEKNIELYNDEFDSETNILDSYKTKKNYEKEKFFELYYDIKSKKINISDLSLDDLNKFNTIIKQEILLKKIELEKKKKENKELIIEINNLKDKVINFNNNETNNVVNN